MKNNAKKLLALLLVALLCVTMVVPAFAAEPTQQSTDPNSNLDSVYADIDFDAETGAITDKYGKLTIKNNGATITETEVTFNNTTLKVPTFNVTASGQHAVATFTEFKSVADANAFWNDADGFSFEALFVNRAHSSTQGVFCSTESAGLGLALTSSGRPGLCLYVIKPGVTATYNYTNPNAALPTNAYSHVVATAVTKADGVHSEVYVNGTLAASNYATNKQSGVTIYTDAPAYAKYFNTFNMGNDAGGQFAATNMSIIDVKVYGAALTAADVATRYNTTMSELEEDAFENVSVSLGDSISANFFTAKAVNHYNNKADFVNPTMRFTLEGKETVVNAIDAGEQLQFVFDGIAPNNLGDTIKAELMVGNDVVEVKEWTVLEYLNALKGMTAAELGMTPTQCANLQTLINDLLVYGGASQTFTNYNTNALVSAGVTGTTFQNVAVPAGVGKVNGDKVNFTAANVWFGNVNKIVFTLVAPDLTDITFKVKVNNGAETVVPAADIVDKGNDVYFVYTDAIKATGFDDIYTLTAYNSNNSVQAKAVYSVSTYVNAYQGGTDASAALVKATYNYGLAAKAFAKVIQTPATVVYYTMGATPVAVNPTTGETLGALTAADGITLTPGNFYLVDTAISTLTACTDLGTAVKTTGISLGLTAYKTGTTTVNGGSNNGAYWKNIGQKNYNVNAFMDGAAMNSVLSNYYTTSAIGTLKVTSVADGDIIFTTNTGATLKASEINAKFAYFTYDGSAIKVATNATPTTPFVNQSDILRYAIDTALSEDPGYIAAAWQAFVDNYGKTNEACPCGNCANLQTHWQNMWLNGQIPSNYEAALANYNKVANTTKPALLQAMNDAQTAFDTALAANATITALKQAADTAGAGSTEETSYITAVKADAILAPLYTELTTATTLYNNYDAYIERYNTQESLYEAFCAAYEDAANLVLWDKANVAGSYLYTTLDGATTLPTFTYFYNVETDTYTIYVTSANDGKVVVRW